MTVFDDIIPTPDEAWGAAVHLDVFGILVLAILVLVGFAVWLLADAPERRPGVWGRDW